MSLFALIVALIAVPVVLLLLLPSDAVRAGGKQGFRIKLSLRGSAPPVYILVKVNGTGVAGTFSGSVGGTNGTPIVGTWSFKGRIDQSQITGRYAGHGTMTDQAGTAIYDNEIDNVVLTIDGNFASSDWYTATDHYRDAATGQGGTFPIDIKFTADLAPLKEGGYELAPAVTTGKTEGNKTVTTTTTKSESGTKSTGAAAAACAALAATASLIAVGWQKTVEIASTVGNFLGGLFGKSVTAEPVSPPVQPQPPLETEPTISLDEVEPPLEPAPPPQEAPASTVPEPAETVDKAKGVEGDKQLTENDVARANALNAERRNLYLEFRSTYDLSGLARDTLLGWLEDKELSVQEVGARANLLVVTDKEYCRFYSDMCSQAVDNVCDGKLWEAAAKLHPLIKVGSKALDLAKMPFDVGSACCEYEDTQAPQRVLDHFVKSYGMTEDAVVAELGSTRNALHAWYSIYRPAETKFYQAEKGVRQSTDGQGVDRPGIDGEKVYDTSHDRMVRVTDEVKDLEAERLALDFRLKAIHGNWKRWVIK